MEDTTLVLRASAKPVRVSSRLRDRVGAVSEVLAKLGVRTLLVYTSLSYGRGLVSICGQVETKHCSVTKAPPRIDRPLTSVQPAWSCFHVAGQLP